MTEEQWLACDDPWVMLRHLKHVAGLSSHRSWKQWKRANDRKLRLFACASLRLVWHSLPETASRHAVAVGEWMADAVASGRERHEARTQARRTASQTYGDAARLGNAAAEVVRSASAWEPARAVRGWWTLDNKTAICRALRDVLGNPFRPRLAVGFCPWPEVLALARVAYEQRTLPSGALDPVCLAVLSDALEEAGCTDADILGHLRLAGPHVRGCWPLDLVLGRE
jgi:hypothetical protein